ncbi:MAG: hypothetical protein Q7T70_06485 [Polaromonas sp.]|nr:hypothetical protein [Polaromonas sp.]
MKTALKLSLGIVLPALFCGQAMACYTVYNRANQVVYHASAAPVDMRYQLHQTLPAVFPGGHMVFSITDTDCPATNMSRAANASAAAASLAERNAFVSDLSMARGETARAQALRPVAPARSQ